MNFGQMQLEVRTRLDEASAVFWTDQDIKDSLNEGLAEMADETDYHECYANVMLAPNRTYYDLTTLLPNTFLSPRRIYNTTTSRWLIPSGYRELDESRGGQWEDTQGPPNWYWFRGFWWLGVYPKEETDTRALRVVFTGIPDPMVLDVDEPDMPREFHFGLVEYALFDCHAQQRETKKALKFWKSFTGYQEDFRKYVDKRLALDRKDTF